MKNNTEFRAALNMTLARLDADPKSSDEWDAIESALSEAAAYAGKTRRMRKYFEERYGTPPASCETSK